MSAIYTSNAGPHTATIQVALTEKHQHRQLRVHGPRAPRDRERAAAVERVFPVGRHGRRRAQPGLAGADRRAGQRGRISATAFDTASDLATKIRALPGVSDVYIPQDLDYPSLQLNIDRERANELGLDQREVVSNVITALTSNGMIAPSYWVDPKSGNDYMLTVQYAENQIHNLLDLRNMPLHAGDGRRSTTLDAVSHITPFKTPTEVDHYQIQRVIDIYVNPATEDLGAVASGVQRILAAEPPGNARVALRGMVEGMNASFRSFGFGLILALVLLYLILVAQFRSFADPMLILLAVPTGLTGVLVALYLTGTTLNVQSLMGVLMMVGHGRVEQHPDRRVHASTRGRRDADVRSRGQFVPDPAAADPDDVARHDHRPPADGAEARHRQRGVRAAGARHHRRSARVGRADRVHRARGVSRGLSAAAWRRGGAMKPCDAHRPRGAAGCLGAAPAWAQAPQPLTLQQAERLALSRIIPQIQAAQYAALAAKEVVREIRSAYFPTVFASVTGAQAQNGSRIAGGRPEQPDHLRPVRHRRHRRAAGHRLRPDARARPRAPR